jgi:hypothetical protein
MGHSMDSPKDFYWPDITTVEVAEDVIKRASNTSYAVTAFFINGVRGAFSLSRLRSRPEAFSSAADARNF